MSSSKNVDMKREFAAGVYLSEAQTPYAETHCIRVYSVLIHTGKGEKGEKWTREEIVVQQFTKNPTWLSVSLVYKHW